MSTRIFFQMHVLLNGEFKDDLKDEQGSASVVLAIANDPLGIGYSSIGFQNAAVRIVPLAEREGDEYVYPTQESVTNGTYPLSRRLNLYINRDPEEALQPAVLEFLKFANSRTGQAVVSDAGVFPLQTYEASANLHILAKWHR